MFNEYKPLLPQVAFPLASDVKTAYAIGVPPVTFKVFVKSALAVIAAAAKLPEASLLTIVFTVLDGVAELIAVAMVVDRMPPTLLTVGKSAVPPKSLASFNLPFVLASASRVAPPETEDET